MTLRAGLGGRRGAMMAGGLAGALTLAAAVAGDACAARRLRSDPEAVRLLQAAAEAARQVPYEGMQVLTTWGGEGVKTSAVKVVHAPGEGTYLDPGAAQGRNGEPPRGAPPAPAPGPTFHADNSAIRGALTGFTTEMLALLTRNYSVVRTADASVCGRRARVIEARRPDGTAAGRFWLDSETGLMLHRELIDDAGRAVASTGFRDLRISKAQDSVQVYGGRSFGESTPEIPKGTAAAALPWRHRLAAGDLGTLREGGWNVPRDLPGRLSLYDARMSAPKADAAGSTVHLSYSDGLAAVSVFVQRGDLDERRFAGWRRTRSDGRTVYQRDSLQRWAVWAGDGYVYTILADAPRGTADSVIKGFPDGGPRFWGRLGRGLRRLGAWVNPFG
ncbi:sigma-E factor regulatory protein RseB domain-containing protein [Spirillospora sp. NPDC047279]|uniref:sigma-E factor regulatory protein RseB domain-containing protein n=1 Tax=Spirillospora sp. NPDC047279 TaxID=3155478 RepID=UPI0033EEA987